MVKHIDLFMPPRSQYGVLHHFSSAFADALQKQSIKVKVMEAERNNPEPFLNELFEHKPDCTLSFNGLLPDDEGRFLCDMIKLPHVACLVDSPNHYFALIKSLYTIITCADRFSCEFFRGMGHPNVIFMPHAVEKNLSPDPSLDRKYEVVMLSSCNDFEQKRELWSGKYPKELCDLLHEAAEITLSEQDTPYVEAFVRCLNTHGSIDPKKLDFEQVLNDLENYVRGVDRIEVVRSITDAKIDIFGAPGDGSGWEKYLGKDRTNITYHAPVSFDEAQTIMKQSKIVLNSCPWIKHGGHERIFSTLACGALSITADNPYMREDFTDGETIGFYRYGEWDKINNQVNGYLSDETRRQDIATKGREVVMSKHTWDHRAEQLLKDLELLLDEVGAL